MIQRPVAIGLTLCEQVIIEEGTRRVTLVNCFTRHTVERFPSETFPFIVFAILADGLGEMLLEVVIHRLDTLEETYRAGQQVRFADPLQNLRCSLRILDCSFPVAGHYQVGLFVGGEMVAQRKLFIQAKAGDS